MNKYEVIYKSKSNNEYRITIKTKLDKEKFINEIVKIIEENNWVKYQEEEYDANLSTGEIETFKIKEIFE